MSEKRQDFRKFQMISYEFGRNQDLYQLTKNFGTKEIIILDKRLKNYIKIPFDALDVFMEYLNQLVKEEEKI